MTEKVRSSTWSLAMSTFYLLPPRPVIGDAFAAFLNQFFPGLDWNLAMRATLAAALGEAAGNHPDVYVVYKDDIPEGEPASQVLAEAFGAEPGDEVVELKFTGR